MKGREVEKLTKQILPHFPGFSVKGALIFRAPIQGFYRGMFLGASSNSNVFYPSMLCTPLFVPFPGLGSFYVERLKNRKGHTSWDWTEPNVLEDLTWAMNRELLPFMKLTDKPQGFIKFAKQHFGENSSNVMQQIAFTLIYIGKQQEAIPYLNRILALPISEYGAEWETKIKNRARFVLSQIQQRPEYTKTQLKLWEDEQLHIIGLAKFAASANDNEFSTNVATKSHGNIFQFLSRIFVK